MKIALTRNWYFEVAYGCIALLFFGINFFTQYRGSALYVLFGFVAIFLMFAALASVMRRLMWPTIKEFFSHFSYSIALLAGVSAGVTFVLFSVLFICAKFWYQEDLIPYELFVSVLRILINILCVYAVFAWLTIFCFLSGNIIFKLKIFQKLNGSAYAFFFKLGIGLYSLMFFYYLLSLGHVLFIGLPVLGVVTVFFLWRFRSTLIHTIFKSHLSDLLQAENRGWTYPALVFIGVILFSIFTFTYFSLVATYIDDFLTYMTVPLTFLKAGGIVDFPYYHLNEALFIGTYLLMPLLQIYSPAAPLMNLYFFGITVILLCVFIKEKYPHASKFFYGATAVALATLTMHSFILASVRPDGLLLFLSLLIFIALSTYDDAPAPLLYVVGIFLGTLVAVKYSMLFILPAIVGLVFFQKNSVQKKLKTLLIIGVFSVAAFAPWGLYNAVHFHNPLHPFFESSNQFYTAYAGFSGEQSFQKKFTNEFQRYYDLGVPGDILSVRQLFAISLLNRGFQGNRFGPLVLLILVAVFIKRTDRLMAAFLVACALCYGGWSVSHVNQVHYLYFLAPLIVLLFGWYMNQFKIRTISYVVLVLLCFNFLNFYEAAHRMNSIFSLGERRDSIMKLYSQTFYFANADLVNQLEKNQPAYVLLPVGDTFYTPVVANPEQHIYEDINLNTWTTIAATSNNSRDVISQLRSRGITHVYVDGKSPLLDNFSSAEYPIFSRAHEQLESFIATAPVILKNQFATIYQVPD